MCESAYADNSDYHDNLSLSRSRNYFNLRYHGGLAGSSLISGKVCDLYD